MSDTTASASSAHVDHETALSLYRTMQTIRQTEEHLARSGILHYHLDEHRFVGPRHDRELTDAALVFLTRSGRLPEQAV